MSPSTMAPVSPSRQPRVFGGHPLHTDGDLLALAYAPDGTLWSVEESGALRHWDLAGRRQLAFHALEEMATVWAFDPGATLLAAGSDEVGLWQTATGEQIIGWSLPAWCTALAFQPNGTLVATGHDDGSVSLWDRTTGRKVRDLPRHARPVSAVAFSVCGTSLATAGEDKTIFVVGADGAQHGELLGHTDRIPALAWHPDGRRLFSAGWDTTVRVWDTATCQPVILLNSHAAQVFSLTLTADGSRLASTDSAAAVHVWDSADYRPQTVFRDQPGEVRCLAFRRDGGQLAWGGADRVIHVADPAAPTPEAPVLDPLLSRTVCAVNPDGTRLLSLGAGTALRVWDTTNARPALELEGAPSLRTFAASPDGQWLAASRADSTRPNDRSTLTLWSASTGKRVRTFDGQAAPLTALAFSPDSATLASSGYQTPDAWLWRVPSGEPLLILPDAADGCSVEALAWHPDGALLGVAGIDWLATGGRDGAVVLWDVATRQPARLLPGGAAALAFHPAGRLLAVASLAQVVRVYDLTGGDLVQTLIGHTDNVTCLAYSPDGRWLVTGGDDRSVRLWEAHSGDPVGAIDLDTQARALAFSPDGQSVFTGNGNTSCYQIALSQLGA